MKILITGGAGFIGSALIRHIISEREDVVLNLDKLTYAGNLQSLTPIEHSPRYRFHHGNICDARTVRQLLEAFQPDAIMHLAAESHVDRSIDGSTDFIQTNIVGTHVLLEEARRYWEALPTNRRRAFRFLHVSTDEVYGDLADSDDLFTEKTPYAPSSPYAASKASSDHLVRTWHRTYGLPILVTNCSNNYGPYQFPEKLIPLTILNAIAGKPLPVYGDGQQIRDWLYVDDHVRALLTVLESGQPGETYNIGGHNEKTNLEVVQTICALLEETHPTKPKGIVQYRNLITYVADRPGHDRRYAIDAGKIERELGWVSEETLETGLRKTVNWYLSNSEWIRNVLDGSYHGKRLVLIAHQR